MPKEPRTIPEQPKNTKGTLLRLWKYLYRFKGLVFLAVSLTLLSNLLALWGPTLSGQAINAIGTEPGKVDFPEVFRYF